MKLWKDDTKFYKQPLFWAIVAVLVVIGGIANAGKVKEEVEEAEEAVEEVSDEELAKEIQSAIEMYCEDLGASAKAYGWISDDVDLADLRNYWSDFNPFSGWFDENGHQIYQYKWRAYNEATGADVNIVCEVSASTADDIDLKLFTVDDTVLWGRENYELYDEKGDLIE